MLIKILYSLEFDNGFPSSPLLMKPTNYLSPPNLFCIPVTKAYGHGKHTSSLHLPRLIPPTLISGARIELPSSNPSLNCAEIHFQTLTLHCGLILESSRSVFHRNRSNPSLMGIVILPGTLKPSIFTFLPTLFHTRSSCVPLPPEFSPSFYTHNLPVAPRGVFLSLLFVGPNSHLGVRGSLFP